MKEMEILTPTLSKGEGAIYTKGNWKYVKLGDVCQILNGFAFKSSKYVDNGIRVIRITNVQKGVIVDDSPKYYPEGSLQEIGKYLLFENDLLVSLTGNVGRVGLINKELLPAALNQRVACLRIIEKNLSLKYLFHYLNSTLFETDCINNSTGAAQLNMSTVWLSKYHIPMPSLSEQQRIVTYLDSAFAKIDQFKENAAKALSEAKALFQAELKKCMEKKEGWEEKTLGKVGVLKRGGNFSKKDFVENGYPCVHYGQIHMKFGICTDQHLSSVPEEMVKKERCATKGDLIIAITSEDDEGSCKCTAWMADYDVYVGGHTAIFTHSLDPVFMSYYFCSPRFQREKLQYTHGFKVVEISPKDIAKISIAYPSNDEQHQIVTHLDSLSQKVKELQQNYNTILAECDALKQAILKETFE